MKFRNYSVVAIEGMVIVTATDQVGRETSGTYYATGVSPNGSLEQASRNMKLNAKYKFINEYNVPSGTTVSATIINYDIKTRKDERFKTSTYKRKNGKSYYITKNAKTGRITDSGRFFYVDDEIENQEDI